MPVGLPPSRAPNCLACRHFIVTWEADYPRGCSIFGIKSRELPSLAVFAATGLHCPAFEAIEPRAERQKNPGEPDDPDAGGIWA